MKGITNNILEKCESSTMVAPGLKDKLSKASSKCNEIDGVIARYDGLSRGSEADRKSLVPTMDQIKKHYEQLAVRMKDVKNLNKNISPLLA